MKLSIGDKVFIRHPDGIVSYHTPKWCLFWTGTVVRLNARTATIEFEVDEPGQKTIQRYIDYQDIQLVKYQQTGGINMSDKISMDHRSRYYQELSRNLRYEGLTVKPETEAGLLPVELDGQRLCLALDTGAVRYWREEASDDHRSAVLDRVISIAKTTAEYMWQMEAAPQLTASGLSGDYRLLAEFNGAVLAGHPSKYGIQFVTWEWVQDHTALYQGNYYGPEGGTDSYAAAKQNFAVRSGLIPHSALFAPEQLTEVYRCIHETLESEYPITDERKKCLESTAEQIEHGIPDLEARVMASNQKEMELAAMEPPQDGGMQFC